MTEMPLFQPKVDYQPPNLSQLPSWRCAELVGIDIETHDPDLKRLGPGVRRGAYIVGVSFSISGGPSVYLPMRHRGGDNLDPEQVLRYLREQAAVFTGTIAGANMQYDLDFLAQAGVVFRRAKWFRDVQVADPLIDELHDSYSLDAIAKRWGFPGKNESVLRDAASAWGVSAKAQMYELPARYVAEYAARDASLVLDILAHQEKEIRRQGITEVYDLESRLLPVLVKMRRRGIRVDLNALDRIEQWSETEEQSQLDNIFDETGVRIRLGDVWKPGALAKALRKSGVDLATTPKSGKPQVNKELLDNLKDKVPVASMIDRARRVNKLRTTFASSVRHYLCGDRIHCTFNQLRRTDDGSNRGARYGRLSSTDPNLQQQPSREDFAAAWRSIYVPDGDLWCAADYSQQEPRMLTHYAAITNCVGAEEVADAYRSDPKTDNHTLLARKIFGYRPDEQPSKKHRTDAKIIFLGLCYSMGGATLAKSLGLPTKFIKNRAGRQIEVAGDQAQGIIDLFNRQVPFVRQLARTTEARAKEQGYIHTLLGRKCRFPTLTNGGYDWTHKALNRLIQGSSADQTKLAMVEADAAGLRLQIQVHDEIGMSIDSPEQASQLAKIMESCVELEVPSMVDVEIGPSWGEAK